MAKKTPKTEGKVVAIGRRRTATATATILPGNGEITVNKQPSNIHFTGLKSQVELNKPFSVTETTGKYTTFVRTSGGGIAGQLGSTVLAISRGLVKLNASFRKPLRDANLLTRDPRERERRKVGTGGKSRRQKQSPKR